MGLFTVKLKRKQIVTTYGADGKATGTREIDLEQSYSGCPSQLVATYKRDFPGAFVSAEQEFAEPGRPGAKVRVSEGPGKRQGRPHTASALAEAPEHVEGYAEALSRAVAREAA